MNIIIRKYEGPQEFSPPVGMDNDRHGNQTSMGWDMGLPTHWSGADNGGAGRDQGVYRLPPEHV